MVFIDGADCHLTANAALGWLFWEGHAAFLLITDEAAACVERSGLLPVVLRKALTKFAEKTRPGRDRTYDTPMYGGSPVGAIPKELDGYVITVKSFGLSFSDQVIRPSGVRIRTPSTVKTPACVADSSSIALCPPPRRIRCSSPRLLRPRNDGMVNVR